MSRLLLYPGLFLSILFLFRNGHAQDRTFSADDLLADLKALTEALERRHANLFIYQEPYEWRDMLGQMEESVPDSANEMEAFRWITQMVPAIADGHTHFLPSRRLDLSTVRLLPLHTFWDGKQLFVLRDLSEKGALPAGTRIVSIEGEKADRICGELEKRMPRDGVNLHYPRWILNRFFANVYGHFYDHPDTLSLEVAPPDGPVNTVFLPAASLKNMERRQKSRFPESVKASATSFTIDSSAQTAILKIPTFYGKQWRGAVRNAFAELRASGIAHLILDLRDNQGGPIQNGDLLLSYLMQEDYRMVHRYARRARRGFLTTMRNAHAPRKGNQRPRKDAFSGKLTLLINGGSYSCSGIVAQVLQSSGRALVLGTPSGGNPAILSGDQRTFVLPRTGIAVRIPFLRFQIQENRYAAPAVIPHETIPTEVQHLIDGKDPVMAKTLLQK